VGGVAARKIVDLRRNLAMFGNFGTGFICCERSLSNRFAKVIFGSGYFPGFQGFRRADQLDSRFLYSVDSGASAQAWLFY
jgi:hypothetical protein